MMETENYTLFWRQIQSSIRLDIHGHIATLTQYWTGLEQTKTIRVLVHKLCSLPFPMALEGFELPSAVTAIFVLHYIFVDTFAVGAARTPYQLKWLGLEHVMQCLFNMFAKNKHATDLARWQLTCMTSIQFSQSFCFARVAKHCARFTWLERRAWCLVPYWPRYPFTTETHDAKNLEPFIRALRAQQNQARGQLTRSGYIEGLSSQNETH